MELLSWLFTERLIRQCFDVSMRTVDARGKQAVSALVNQICGVDVGDVSRIANQCECLLGAILVCPFFLYVYYLLFEIFRMGMQMIYATKLD